MVNKIKQSFYSKKKIDLLNELEKLVHQQLQWTREFVLSKREEFYDEVARTKNCTFHSFCHRSAHDCKVPCFAAKGMLKALIKENKNILLNSSLMSEAKILQMCTIVNLHWQKTITNGCLDYNMNVDEEVERMVIKKKLLQNLKY